MSDFSPTAPPQRLRLRLIACEIFYREFCACIATSPHVVDAQFMTQGLHDLPTERMVARLQTEIDATDPERYDAILLGFALCNNGIVGLTHKSLRVIVPRSHDCIALLMGSREAYDTYFKANPGTYYKTSGWIERDFENLEDETVSNADSPFGPLNTFEQFVEQYGEENAKYLMETMGYTNNYTHMAYIDLPGMAPLPYEEDTRAEAEATGLEFDLLRGNIDWIRRLTDGPWTDDDFLVLEPGQRIAPSHDETILKAE